MIVEIDAYDASANTFLGLVPVLAKKTDFLDTSTEVYKVLISDDGKKKSELKMDAKNLEYKSVGFGKSLQFFSFEDYKKLVEEILGKLPSMHFKVIRGLKTVEGAVIPLGCTIEVIDVVGPDCAFMVKIDRPGKQLSYTPKKVPFYLFFQIISPEDKKRMHDAFGFYYDFYLTYLEPFKDDLPGAANNLKKEKIKIVMELELQAYSEGEQQEIQPEEQTGTFF